MAKLSHCGTTGSTISPEEIIMTKTEDDKMEDNNLEFEVFRCQTLAQALAHVPFKRRWRAFRNRKIIDD